MDHVILLISHVTSHVTHGRRDDVVVMFRAGTDTGTSLLE